jgi:DNA-binding GntR family transcriptional regulator
MPETLPGQLAEPGGGSARTVYQSLRDAIVDGDIAPGAVLVEGAIAKQYEVSRSPVREAFSQLSFEGLLERRDRAVRVRILTPEQVLELYEVRIVLEAAAASSAAQRRSDFDVAALSRIRDDMRNLDTEQIESRPTLAHALHFAIWRASHNRFLQEVLESVHLRVTALSSTTLHINERWATFLEQSELLVQAIVAREVEAAAEIAQRQMISARDYRVFLYSSGRQVHPAV